MDTRPLSEVLRELETRLHQPGIRRDRAALGALLHPCFHEFGRSGDTFTREQTLAEFDEQPQSYEIWAQSYEVQELTQDLALLTYKSAHLNSEGQLERYTNRSSLWQLTQDRWLLRFHQGTPTHAFDKDAT